MKLKQVYNSSGFLKLLSEKELPTVLAFKISKVIKSCQNELVSFEEVRAKKFEQWGEVVDGVDGTRIKEKFIPQFNKEINELLEQEVNVIIPEVSITEFSDVKLSSDLLVNLDWLIKE